MTQFPYDFQLLKIEDDQESYQTNLFPTPVFEFDLSNRIDFSEIKKHVESYHEDYKTDWNKYTTHDLITTPDDLHMDKRFSGLMSLLDHYSRMVINKLNIKSDSYYFLGMWANTHRRCATHHSHQHPNSFLSGVVYVDVPEKSGGLYFEDPRDAKALINYDYGDQPFSMFQSRAWEFEPKVGKLIVFPSWLRHGTHPSDLADDEHRMSISFNIYPRYKCSRNTMKIEL